jgi:hypothetical protein
MKKKLSVNSVLYRQLKKRVKLNTFRNVSSFVLCNHFGFNLAHIVLCYARCYAYGRLGNTELICKVYLILTRELPVDLDFLA